MRRWSEAKVWALNPSRTSALDGSIPFHEIALLAVVIMVFAYGVRFIEFTFFSHRN